MNAHTCIVQVWARLSRAKNSYGCRNLLGLTLGMVRTVVIEHIRLPIRRDILEMGRLVAGRDRGAGPNFSDDSFLNQLLEPGTVRLKLTAVTLASFKHMGNLLKVVF